jgi:branched-chain amino acid transport system substrate-binding protein
MPYFARLLAIFVSLLLAASAAGAQSKPSGPPFKFGVLLPLTGSGASFGEDGQIGLKIALNEINAHGGVLGRPAIAVIKDDMGDAATAAKVALQLTQEDKVDAILGPVFSNASAAVLPVTTDAKIVQIAESYLTDEGNAAKYPYVFKSNPTAASVGEAFGPYVRKLKMSKVAIIAVDNLQGSGVADGAAASLQKQGVALVDRATMASGATDVTPQLDRLRRGAPQALILAMAYGPDYVTVLKGLKQIGWIDVIPMGTSAINFAVVVQSAPPDIFAHSYGSGGVRNLTSRCEPPAVKRFRKEVSDESFNHGPITRDITFVATEYDSALIVANAANGSRSTAAPAIKSYLETHPQALISGTYGYTAERHDGLRTDDFVFVKAGLPNNGLTELAPGQSCT